MRELVNLCRRLTVLAPGTEISVEDLPPELGAAAAARSVDADWSKALAIWADRHAMTGKRPLAGVDLVLIGREATRGRAFAALRERVDLSPHTLYRLVGVGMSNFRETPTQPAAEALEV